MIKRTMTRRSFIKTAAAIGAAAGLSTSLAPMQALGEAAADAAPIGSTKVVRTCCRGCGKMECGVLVTVRDGRAIKVEGDPTAFQSMGSCCTKSQSSMQACYHPDRVLYPMQRTNPKGTDDPGWKRITWQDAMDTIAIKIPELIDKWTGQSLVTYCGTSRIWAMTPGGYGRLFGTSNGFGAWQICKGPRHFNSAMVSEFAWSWMEVVARPLVYVQWGGASEMSNYDDSCRTTVDCAFKADTHILVDPRMTNCGKEADIWMNVRPGTDGALALSWANVAINEDLVDWAYIKKWTNGPFLVVPDMEPSKSPLGNFGLTATGITTKLLKESDMIEGGKPTRFMVWDDLNDRLTYFDAARADGFAYEGEHWQPQVNGHEAMQRGILDGVAQGWVADLSGFDVEDGFDKPLDPALYGEYEVTLKDGTVHKARPVWDLYHQRMDDYTPEKVSEITNIPADRIREAARVYATRIDPLTGYGNGGIQYMLANEHYGQAVENCRCLDLLAGITGNYDTPAGMRGTTRAPIGMDCGNAGPGIVPYAGMDPSKKIGMEHRPMFKWWPMWGDAVWINQAMNTGEPYPIKGGMCGSGDFMNMCNSNVNYTGLLTLDFFFTIDLWFSPITGASDLVLPVHHWMELNAPRRCQGSSGAYGCNIRCVEPHGEAMWDPVILIDVCKALGVPYSTDIDDPWPGEKAGDMWSKEAQKLGEYYVLDRECKDTNGWDPFAKEFEENGWFDAKAELPNDWGTYRRFEVGQARRGMPFSSLMHEPIVPGFGTPTAKHEIWSTIMETCWPGGDRELPRYFEPLESPISTPDLFEKYPLMCITGRRIPVYFHNEHRQLPWCRELWPVPRVEINPVDAAKLGLEQGDWVWIENDRGKIRQVVDLYHGIEPGRINCEHQWWFPELQQADKGFGLCGVNCLVNPLCADPDSGASMVRGYAVKVYKATPDNCPNGQVIPAGNDGTLIIHGSDDERLKNWLAAIKGEE